VDDKVGQLLRALESAGFAEDTVVILASDHGEMLGERGLWYKMSFFEDSVRVPLVVHAPGRFVPRRLAQPVSLADLLPTLVELGGGGQAPNAAAPLDGRSLVPLLAGDGAGRPAEVASEYLAEGALAPMFMLRRGRYKYVFCQADPDQLYDLEADPRELRNLAGLPDHEETRRALHDEVLQRWNPEAVRQDVLASQRRRRLVAQALASGRRTPWDFQPRREASEQYMRGHLDLDTLERSARFPYQEPPPPDGPEA
jgi:choline-sulfatase